MKYFVKFFVVTSFLIICTHVLAEQKVVYMDMKFILNNSQAGKGAQDFLKKTFKEKEKKFTSLEKSLKKEEDDLLAKKKILSKEEYTTKMNNLRKKVIDYQSERRAALDKIAKQRTDARMKLLEKLDPILKSYIEENNISLIVDKKNVLIGNSDLDITNIIIDKLNKELPSLSLK